MTRKITRSPVDIVGDVFWLSLDDKRYGHLFIFSEQGLKYLGRVPTHRYHSLVKLKTAQAIDRNIKSLIKHEQTREHEAEKALLRCVLGQSLRKR